MEKEKALAKLKELGIQSTNYTDQKRPYTLNGRVCIGVFPAEASRDTHFYFNLRDILYSISQEDIKSSDLDTFQGKEKYQVPLEKCSIIWEDRPFEEVVDLPFSKMTARMFYAMLQNKPVSNVDWLDALIRQNQKS
jgi:hypothetical protein